MVSFFVNNFSCWGVAPHVALELCPLNSRLKAVHMATIGDILLLATTSKDPSHKYTQSITLNIDPETHAVLSALVTKLNNYSERKFTLSSLTRALVYFSKESLELPSLLEEQDPLCVLPATHSIRNTISQLGNMSDVVGVPSEVLTEVEDFKKGSVLWKP